MYSVIFFVGFYIFIIIFVAIKSINNQNNLNKPLYQNKSYSNHTSNQVSHLDSHSNVYAHNSDSDVHKIYERVNSTNYTTHSNDAHTIQTNVKTDYSSSPIHNEFGISTQEIRDAFGENNPIKNYYENDNSIEDYKSFWQRLFKM